MSEPLPVVACMPVELAKELMPDFLERSSYSTYVQVLCPACDALMWLGERGRATVEAGKATMLCMPCVVRTHGPGELASMFKLTDLDP